MWRRRVRRLHFFGVKSLRLTQPHTNHKPVFAEYGVLRDFSNLLSIQRKIILLQLYSFFLEISKYFTTTIIAYIIIIIYNSILF